MNKTFKSTDHLRAYKGTMSQLACKSFMNIDSDHHLGPGNLMESAQYDKFITKRNAQQIKFQGRHHFRKEKEDEEIKNSCLLENE